MLYSTDERLLTLAYQVKHHPNRKEILFTRMELIGIPIEHREHVFKLITNA